ncbi:unnamed protein product [Phytomonas sp. EM1]|nr:unnamed protein product [Phytomonas sp. EM1]|eukprot:CCW63222.1 unnamed protein product [Phytomonas sp. isolate EM1]
MGSFSNSAEAPPLAIAAGGTNGSPSHAHTSAVTRSWSDVNQVKLLSTFAATSFVYSLLGHPLFLVIARQQCEKFHISAYEVVLDVLRGYGLRGLYHGAGAAITGTVLSELLYYTCLEYWKEKLPHEDREWRSFGAGLLADALSTPFFNPFGVVSQVQMVAGGSFASEHNYMSAWRTMLTLTREQGVRRLFRGTFLTLVVAPLSGAWWFAYEFLKAYAYGVGPAVGAFLSRNLPLPLIARLPAYCTSTTDNLLINCLVATSTSVGMGILMNPIYVLRLRLQVNKTVRNVRCPIFYILKDILHHEGVGALWKGLGVNLFAAAMGGCVFGITYESAKRFSDNTDTAHTPG